MMIVTNTTSLRFFFLYMVDDSNMTEINGGCGGAILFESV
mgnify:CR=1 FL=1|jgi:hypothetical protein